MHNTLSNLGKWERSLGSRAVFSIGLCPFLGSQQQLNVLFSDSHVELVRILASLLIEHG